MIRLDDSELREEFDGLVERVRNLRPVFADVVEDFHGLMSDAFATGGAAIGRRWAGNVPGWSAQKPGRPVGVFEGVLRGSLVSPSAQYAIADVMPDRVRLGSSAPHAPLFDAGRGGQRPRNLEPPVAMLESRWLPLVEQHLFGDAGVFDGII